MDERTEHFIGNKLMIKELEQTERWTFNFLGADLDAAHTSAMLNIKLENTFNDISFLFSSTILGVTSNTSAIDFSKLFMIC